MNYVDSIRKVMDVSMLRTHVISDNITNFNTPSYKAKKVDDGNLFQLEMSNDMKMTNKKHMSINTSGSNDSTVYTRTDTKERYDGNNVDLNVEMMELTKANGTYGKAIEAINREFALRKLALGSQG
ncbi:flagellar basal body rod protein FlgB [Bacillus bombysepticus]|uniref:flagellar basal body rod protein FlgB n=1 Tax=Bacillus bombysepticus TaxID=658666 RepID=UPI003017E059